MTVITKLQFSNFLQIFVAAGEIYSNGVDNKKIRDIGTYKGSGVGYDQGAT